MASKEETAPLVTEIPESTPESGGRENRGSHTRMHFHSVHNEGERLRRGGKPHNRHRGDRMEGR